MNMFCSVPVNFFLARGHAIFQGVHTKYSTLIYESTLADCRFSSVSGQVAVAVGFLTRDLSRIWNTGFEQNNATEKKCTRGL